MSDNESADEILDEVDEVSDNNSDEEYDGSTSGSDSLDEDYKSDDDDMEYREMLDPMEIKQSNDYPITQIVLHPNERRSNKDFLDQVETAQLVATFTQMISNHNYIPPINTDGYDDPRDIAIKAIQERGLGREKQTIPIMVMRKLPLVVDRTNGKTIQYVEYINPNDEAIALPFLPPLRELSKAV